MQQSFRATVGVIARLVRAVMQIASHSLTSYEVFITVLTAGFKSYKVTARCFIEWDEPHRTQVISLVLTPPLSDLSLPRVIYLKGVVAQETALLTDQKTERAQQSSLAVSIAGLKYVFRPASICGFMYPRF
jgi:hypothetical protein